MGKTKTKPSQHNESAEIPSINPWQRENQMIARAMDLADQQLRDGTASSQVITHFLKLGSQREKLERERLEEENKLLRAKTEALQSAKVMEELYTKAIESMQVYKGEIKEGYDDYDED